MGALVTVKLAGVDGIIGHARTTAPGGAFAVAIELPETPGSYDFTVTVFDQYLRGTANLTLDVIDVPTVDTWYPDPLPSAPRPPPVPTPPAPNDLTVSSITLSGGGVYSRESGQTAVEEGSTLTVAARVSNRGNPGLNAVSVRFYTEQPGSASRTFLAEELVTIPADGVVTVARGEKFTVSIPWVPDQQGPNRIYVVVDVNDDVPEDVETNNDSSRVFNVTPDALELCPVDLLFSNPAPKAMQPSPTTRRRARSAPAPERPRGNSSAATPR